MAVLPELKDTSYFGLLCVVRESLGKAKISDLLKNCELTQVIRYLMRKLLWKKLAFSCFTRFREKIFIIVFPS